jgi:hypothetical protein
MGFFTTGGYLLWSQQQAVAGSAEITGTIESASVEERTTQRDVDDDGMVEDDTEYYAQITYNYTYQGQQYQSSNVFPGAGDPSISQGEASEIVNGHSAGTETSVYVDTDNPGNAYLVEEQNLAFPIGFTLFGGVLALLSGFTLYSRLTGGD